MGTIDQIRAFTRLKINRLLSDQSDSSARASLANLRRGANDAILVDSIAMGRIPF